MLTFLSIADKRRPKWILWENVPGVLSSNGGKDFGTFLGALGELGYGFAYRVLDAQHFGVAQRRRRVFVVGHLGDWRPAAAVLFESESLQRNFKQSRTKREETPTDAQGGVRATSDVSCAGGNVSPCVTSKWKTGYGGPSGKSEADNMVYEQVAQPIAYSFDSLASNSMKSSNPHSGCREVETSKTIDTTTPEPSKNQGGIAIAQPKYFESHPQDSRVTGPYDVGNTVSAKYGTGGGNTPLVSQPFRKVRRAQSETDFETWEKDEKANTLNCFDQGDVRSTNVVAQPIAFQPGNLARKGGADPSTKTFPTLTKNSGDQSPHVAQPVMLDDQGGSVMRVIEDGVCGTLRRETHGHEPCVAQPIALASKQYSQNIGNNIANPLLADDYKEPQVVAQPISWDSEVNCNVNKMGTIVRGGQGGRTDGVAQPIAVNAPTIIDRAAFNQGENAQYEPRIEEGQTMPSLVAKGPHAVQHTMAIRRLTPKECERLQGFPDDWTKIPYRNKPADQCPDGPRYKACGNSMAVPVMRWIGERIQMIENYLNPNL